MARNGYRHEWGRGPERLKNATEKLAPLWEIRRLLHEENKHMFPFSEDYNALHSTLDHIERLDKHFGVLLNPLNPPYRVPESTKDFANRPRAT